MSNLFKSAFLYIIEGTATAFLRISFFFIPDYHKMQEMCNEAMRINSLSLLYVPYHLKTKKMCERAVEEKPCTLKFVPDHFKTIEMCEKAIGKELYTYVPDQ